MFRTVRRAGLRMGANPAWRCRSCVYQGLPQSQIEGPNDGGQCTNPSCGQWFHYEHAGYGGRPGAAICPTCGSPLGVQFDPAAQAQRAQQRKEAQDAFSAQRDAQRARRAGQRERAAEALGEGAEAAVEMGKGTLEAFDPFEHVGVMVQGGGSHRTSARGLPFPRTIRRPITAIEEYTRAMHAAKAPTKGAFDGYLQQMQADGTPFHTVPDEIARYTQRNLLPVYPHYCLSCGRAFNGRNSQIAMVEIAPGRQLLAAVCVGGRDEVPRGPPCGCIHYLQAGVTCPWEGIRRPG